MLFEDPNDVMSILLLDVDARRRHSKFKHSSSLALHAKLLSKARQKHQVLHVSQFAKAEDSIGAG